ncbi:hypothetical protein BHM03_00046833 [Ensete ventricosum]|nr:hypothetical protein BHM03_00046833 [Ensete ventricosum]
MGLFNCCWKFRHDAAAEAKPEPVGDRGTSRCIRRRHRRYFFWRIKSSTKQPHTSSKPRVPVAVRYAYLRLIFRLARAMGFIVGYDDERPSSADREEYVERTLPVAIHRRYATATTPCAAVVM